MNKAEILETLETEKERLDSRIGDLTLEKSVTPHEGDDSHNYGLITIQIEQLIAYRRTVINRINVLNPK